MKVKKLKKKKKKVEEIEEIEENAGEAKEEVVVSNESILQRVLSLNLPLPSVCRVTVNVKKPDKVAKLIEEIKKISANLSKLDKELLYEERILSKFIYKFNNPMLPFIHWRYVRRMAQCSKKRSNIKLNRLINKLNLSLESFNSFERETYMPSPKLVEYVLIRLMGAVALNIKAYEFCAVCFIKLKQYLFIGHNIYKIVALIAVSSRLWILHRTFSLEILDLYPNVRRLYKTISPNWKRFPSKPTKWLTNNLGLDCSNLNDATPLLEMNISTPNIEIYSQQQDEEDIGEPV
uniref:Nucleolus and neural progenitor protein-like N-terminal domain-containing protein n=1 Tax=Octopus bimaculoides TaxID=37653 RepID=A0A0L8H3B8_OCTBM